MKTLKEKLQEYLAEMQATAKKFEELMNTPGIVWPELEGGEFKEGEEVIVTGDKRALDHGMPIGTIGRVIEVDDNCAYCSFPTDDKRWVGFEDLKRVK